MVVIGWVVEQIVAPSHHLTPFAVVDLVQQEFLFGAWVAVVAPVEDSEFVVLAVTKVFHLLPVAGYSPEDWDLYQ